MLLYYTGDTPNLNIETLSLVINLLLSKYFQKQNETLNLTLVSYRFSMTIFVAKVTPMIINLLSIGLSNKLTENDQKLLNPSYRIHKH